MPVPPLLFAAHGDRARSWADVVRRSRELTLFAAIDLAAGGIEGLQEALDARPDAAVAVWTKGPLEATRFAERLTEHAGPSVLHPAPQHPPLGGGVQITHGWLTLSGIAAIERLFASSSRPESVRLRVRGVPEGPGTGLVPALYQALTIAHRLGRRIEVTRALLDDEQHLAIGLDVDGVPWRVEVAARKGPEMHLAVRTATGDYVWSADAVSESLERSSAEPRAMPAVPWAERCLRQLASPVEGADLADARATRALVDAVELALERRLPPTPFAHELTVAALPVPEVSGSFRVPSMHELDALEADALARIGLSGEGPDAPALVPTLPPSTPLPLEALAYRLELRPAVMLEVQPHEADRVAALLPGTVVRRERRVPAPPSVSFGEPTEHVVVDLFAARDEEIAERLAALSIEDPVEAASSIGGLLGYPACCVQAFVAQGEAWDESESRYAIAARTSFGPGAWPALLDDTSLELLPHFPCTYRCERSREQAEALVAALATEDPALREAIVRYLGGPVLYFDRDHQIRFRGAVSEGGIAYRGVSMPWRGSLPFGRLAATMARGDRLVLGEGALTIFAGEQPILSIERTDPGLGVILPFGTI